MFTETSKSTLGKENQTLEYLLQNKAYFPKLSVLEIGTRKKLEKENEKHKELERKKLQTETIIDDRIL